MHVLPACRPALRSPRLAPLSPSAPALLPLPLPPLPRLLPSPTHHPPAHSLHTPPKPCRSMAALCASATACVGPRRAPLRRPICRRRGGSRCRPASLAMRGACAGHVCLQGSRSWLCPCRSQLNPTLRQLVSAHNCVAHHRAASHPPPAAACSEEIQPAAYAASLSLDPPSSRERRTGARHPLLCCCKALCKLHAIAAWHGIVARRQHGM